MARNAAVLCTAGQWNELTDSEDATGNVSIALIDGPCWIQATTTGTAPTGGASGLPLLAAGDGWSEATIAAKFPEPFNAAGAAVRLWAWPMQAEGSSVSVIYA